MAVQIQVRRDTATNWTSNDPTLASGEIGHETDTGKVKFGDGSTAWTALDYFAGEGGNAILGDAPGRVMRIVELKIEDGTNANTIKCTVTSVWNGDIIAETDNIVKDGTTGNFDLSSSGKALTIINAGLTGNALAVFNNLVYHDASAAFNPIFITTKIESSPLGIGIGIRKASDGVSQDWTDVMDDGAIVWTKVNLLYITDA